MISNANEQPLHRHPTFHADVDGFFICPIQASIEEVMHVQILAVTGTIPMPLLHQGAISEQCPTQIVISFSLHFLLRCS